MMSAGDGKQTIILKRFGGENEQRRNQGTKPANLGCLVAWLFIIPWRWLRAGDGSDGKKTPNEAITY